MASSSGSPSTFDEVYLSMVNLPRYLPRRPGPVCKHGSSVVRTSRTPDNPGRRFYCCHVGGKTCDIWDWIDDPLTDHHRGYINEVTNERNLAQEQLRHTLLREEVIAKQVEPLRNECNEANKKIEDIDCTIADLQEKIHNLEATGDAQKKKIMVLKMLFFFSLIIIACVLQSK